MHGAPEDSGLLAASGDGLLDGLDLAQGVRLIGVGVSGFVTHAQSGLFELEAPVDTPAFPEAVGESSTAAAGNGDAAASNADADEAPSTLRQELTTRFSPGTTPSWRPGMDVHHDEFGAGWVWGSGRGRVTVRFEGPLTPKGPVRTFAVDDPALTPG